MDDCMHADTLLLNRMPHRSQQQIITAASRGAPERVVEVEEALLRLDAQEGGHVLKVGQRGRQAHQPHHLLGGLWGARGGGEEGGVAGQEGET